MSTTIVIERHAVDVGDDAGSRDFDEHEDGDNQCDKDDDGDYECDAYEEPAADSGSSVDTSGTLALSIPSRPIRSLVSIEHNHWRTSASQQLC